MPEENIIGQAMFSYWPLSDLGGVGNHQHQPRLHQAPAALTGDAVTDIDSLLRSTGAILEGHFRLASGRHSGTYIEKFRIMEDPAATTALCGMIADHFRDAGATVVVGPAMGGVILAYETARQLGVRTIFAEKDADGGLIFDRGFEIAPGQPRPRRR